MRLTRDEIYVVVFILVALVVGSVVKHYRHQANPPLVQPAPGK
jgi:hypothetical protein